MKDKERDENCRTKFSDTVHCLAGISIPDNLLSFSAIAQRCFPADLNIVHSLLRRFAETKQEVNFTIKYHAQRITLVAYCLILSRRGRKLYEKSRSIHEQSR